MTQLARYSIAFVVPPAYFVYIDFRGGMVKPLTFVSILSLVCCLLEMIQLPTAPL